MWSRVSGSLTADFLIPCHDCAERLWELVFGRRFFLIAADVESVLMSRKFGAMANGFSRGTIPAFLS